jgi:hypothetical protein
MIRPSPEAPISDRNAAHHRVVHTVEHFCELLFARALIGGESITAPGAQVNGLVEVEKRVAVVALHAHQRPQVVDNDTLRA